MPDETTAARVRAAPVWATLALTVVFGLDGCAHYIGTTASSFLKVIREDNDPNKRYLAYAKLASPNCYDSEEQRIQASRTLAKVLRDGYEPAASRAVICRTLGELRRPEGRDSVKVAAEDENPLVRAEALRALGKLGKPEDVAILSRHMAADKEDCRYAAIEGIGELKPKDPNVEIALVDGMEDLEPGVRLASYRALVAVIGKDLGTEVEPWRKDAQARLVAAEKARTASAEKPKVSVEKAKTPARR